MKISKANIEEYIFDYYEGNLTTSDSNKLLDFIHQNPEFESLFSSWAMTYAHKEAQPKKYNLEAVLLKKTGFQWGRFLFVAALFLIPSLGYYNFDVNKENSNNTIQTSDQYVPEAQPNVLKTNTAVEICDAEPVLRQTTESKIPLEKVVVEKTSYVSTEEIKIDTIESVLVPVLVEAEEYTHKQIQLETRQLEALKSQSSPEKNTQSVQRTQKQKRVPKRFKIEPVNKIKPINSDF